MILLVVEERSRRTGYTPTPEGLAREMAYVLLKRSCSTRFLSATTSYPNWNPYTREE
jgi:hypothetical protein